MRADTGGGATLAGVLVEGGDLPRAGVGARQCVGRARDGDDDVVVVEVDGAEEDDLGIVGEPDAGDAAPGAALRADVGGGEVQQAGLAGDEDELLLAGLELDGDVSA